MKFRKKPVVVEARRVTPKNANEIILWAHDGLRPEANARIFKDIGGGLSICTLEGYMHASVGDWIIKGVEGEFYPCKPDIFEATYEPVEEQ